VQCTPLNFSLILAGGYNNVNHAKRLQESRSSYPIQPAKSEGKIERRTFVQFSLSPYSTSMSLDNALSRSKFSTLHKPSGKVSGASHVEELEHFIRIFHIETTTIVTDKIDGLPICLGYAKLDLRYFPGVSGFPSIDE
jgi:hypothetical protein